MAALRTPVTGCPWDLEQTFATIAHYTLEEAYEVADAIAKNDLVELREELGEEIFHSLVNAFFENADTLVVQVTEAASSGDGESYDRLLHTLKGAADNLGFTTLSKTAEALRTSGDPANQETLLTVELEKAKNRYRKIAI